MDAAQSRDRAEGALRAADGVARPTPFTSGRPSWSRRGSRSKTSPRSGTPSGRSGADEVQPAVASGQRRRRLLECRASACRRTPKTLANSSNDPWARTRQDVGVTAMAGSSSSTTRRWRPRLRAGRGERRIRIGKRGLFERRCAPAEGAPGGARASTVEEQSAGPRRVGARERAEPHPLDRRRRSPAARSQACPPGIASRTRRALVNGALGHGSGPRPRPILLASSGGAVRL